MSATFSRDIGVILVHFNSCHVAYLGTKNTYLGTKTSYLETKNTLLGDQDFFCINRALVMNEKKTLIPSSYFESVLTHTRALGFETFESCSRTILTSTFLQF